MTVLETSPLRVFISYSHQDERLRRALDDHLAMLRREGVISVWNDRLIGPGHEWAGEIDDNLNSADMILLLVSPSFIASSYAYDKEMQRAMERQVAGQATVIPIIVRPVDWEGAPFAKLQFLPRDGRPVVTWPNRDEAWRNVAQGIREAARRLHAR